VKNDVASIAIYKEHVKIGHSWRDHTDDLKRFNIDIESKRIYQCSCGWLGWFSKADLSAN
jgi:hypothetical protein